MTRTGRTSDSGWRFGVRLRGVLTTLALAMVMTVARGATIQAPVTVARGATVQAQGAAAWAQVPAVPIAVERRFADAAHLKVGDTLHVAMSATAPGRLAQVAAIYDPAPDPATIMRRDYHVRLHLADLASLLGQLGQPDRVDRIGIALRPGVDPDSAAARLNLTAFGYDVFPSHAIATQSSMTFVVVSRFHRAIAIISILASTVFLLCLMLLKVEERRRDVAVLRFTGISRRTVFLALVLEAAVVAVAGSVIGAVIAAVASTAVNAFYQRAFDTALIFSLYSATTVAFAMALSLVLGVAAGALAAWRMVRLSPLELWGR
ncbi:MAG: ABC transporter permease, partial [Gemmatimonadota bacterium]